MPAPAVDRDPAQGGLGLHLVARLSVAHGWYVDDGTQARVGLPAHAVEDRSRLIWTPRPPSDGTGVGADDDPGHGGEPSARVAPEGSAQG